MKQLPKSLLGLTFCGCMALQAALAGGLEVVPPPPPPPPNLFWSPLLPGVSFAGAFIDQNSGWADILVPVIQPSPTTFFYFDPQTLYHSNNEYSASIGSGFRMLTPLGIWGAYVFGDYDHSQNNNSYWFVSPGIERLGETLDFSVNGYFPVDTERHNTTMGFASEFGDTDSVYVTGHSEFDEIVQNFESVGPGVDGEIGYRLPFLRNNTKLYLGGYYFAPKDTDTIGGGLVKLDIPANNWLSINVSDTYDNVFHNTFKVGASLSLWGRSTHFYDHHIETRMVDPIQRNLIAEDGSSSTDQYIAKGQEDLGSGLLLSNIWFFAPDGTYYNTAAFSECTAEHPCATPDVNTNFFSGINAIAPNANMFLATGTYSNLANGSSFGGVLDVDAGQSVYGRNAGFTTAAKGNNRPLLIGSVDLNSNTLLDSLRLGDDGIESLGVLVLDDSTNVRLSNDLIGNTGSDSSQTYLTGVQIGSSIGNTSVSISNSEIDTVNSTTVLNPADISVPSGSNNNSVTIAGTTLNALTVDGGSDNVAAIYNDGFGNNFSLTDNTMNVRGGSPFVLNDQNGTGDNTWYLNGNAIYSTSNEGTIVWYNAGGHHDNVIFTNNTISAVNSGGGGVDILKDMGGENTYLLDGNKITATETGSAEAIIIDDESFDGKDNWTITNNDLVANSASSAVGFKMEGTSTTPNNATVTMSNNVITILGSGSVAQAIDDVSSGGNIWKLTNNAITVNTNFGNAWVILDESAGGNAWVLKGNAASVSASSIAGNAYGIEDKPSLTPLAGNYWNLSNNIFYVNSAAGGSSGNAFGFSIARDDDTIYSTNDGFIVRATGSGANAYGFAANVSGAATGGFFDLQGDLIQALGAGDAYGVYDAAGNTNTWFPGNNAAGIIGNNTITATSTSGGQACKVTLNGGATCYN